MRVGIVTTSYPRADGDPAGHFVAAHAHALHALGHSVEVIAAGLEPHAIDRDVDELGVRVHRIDGRGLFDRGGAPDALEVSPRLLPRAARFTSRLTAVVRTRAARWDRIVAHWLAPSAIAALPARRPLLAIAHGGDVHTLRRLHLLGSVLRLLRRRDARLAFVSGDLLAEARRAAPALDAWLATAHVQPMGLELARFAALPRAPEPRPIVLVAARLVHIKGVDLALDALACLDVPLHLVVIGDGPERAGLERRAAAINEAARGPTVELRGQVATPMRDQLLARASAVLVPSRVLANGRTEGMPLIALEALAAGVPVIATATGGLRALAPTISLVDPDADAIAAAIRSTLGMVKPDPAVLRAAVAHLDWRAVAPRLL